jgi:PAS domain S-box-containing protein
MRTAFAQRQRNHAQVQRDKKMNTTPDLAQDQPLLKTSALQNAIFNSANFSCIATDAEGVIQIFNVGAERMLGYHAADMVNKLTPAAISDGDELIARAKALTDESRTQILPGFDAMVYRARRSIEDIYELTYIRQDGSRFPAIVSVTALRGEQDIVIGYLLVGTDNTARKQVEASHLEAKALLDQALHDRQLALEEKNVELADARAIAEKANLAKSEFLSSMSHELRTPLNAVLGFAQLMESATPLPSPAQKLSIEQILKGGWYLLKLINEILDLAMIESGKMAMSKEAVALSDVLQDCQTMIEPQAAKRGVRMTFPRLENMCYVHADHTRLKQVMINLLSNAIKYNSADGTVIVQCGPVSGDRIRISVADTGAGLAPEQLARLFQPFNRLGKETSGEEGTGVGLVVTRQLVELMGGAVGVESIVGAGSTFWVELPATGAPELSYGRDVGVTTEEKNHVATYASSSPRTLLYVEDNPANLALVEQLISRRSDLRLLMAIDADIGIELARTHRPDVILMDINLPGMSGYDALKVLQNNPDTAHIPVIAISANAIPRDIERGMAAGFFRYLTKPIKFDEFMVTLNIALHRVAENETAANAVGTQVSPQ